MTDHERRDDAILAVLNAQFSDFIDRYERDQFRAQEWREKFEDSLDKKLEPLIHCVFGNSDIGLKARVYNMGKTIKSVGVFVSILLTAVLAWLGLK